MAKKSEKQKRGRPTKYNPKYHLPWARGLARRGLTIEEIAKEMELSTATIYNWMGDHEDFLEAINEGRSYADCIVEESLFKRATGGTYTEKRMGKRPDRKGDVKNFAEVIEREVPPDTAACIFWLKNRIPYLWRDKVDTQAEQATEQILETFENVIVKIKETADADRADT